jgi:hypothetical protein
MKTKEKTKNYIYTVILFFITLSGFAQMPIFKRYYIADIPGLSWLAQFYITHIIHYIAAFALIAFAMFILFNFFLNKPELNKITGYVYFKILIISGLIVSGILMAIKNLPSIFFDHNLIIVLDLVHLSLCMMLIFVTIHSLIKQKES